jgi:hypothetical protein
MHLAGGPIPVDASVADEYWGRPTPFSAETWHPTIGSVAFIRPLIRASRMISQRGIFSVHLRPNEEWRGFRRANESVLGGPNNLNVLSANYKVERYAAIPRFPVPASYKAHFRMRLAGLGVDASSIMADLGGLCDALEWRYRNREV